MDELLALAGKLTTEDLEKLIEQLWIMRAHREPEIPRQPPLMRQVQAVPDPNYWTEPDQMNGTTLLAFRHPGLGWLWFSLPVAERMRLIQLLQSQQMPQESPGRAN